MRFFGQTFQQCFQNSFLNVQRNLFWKTSFFWKKFFLELFAAWTKSIGTLLKIFGGVVKIAFHVAKRWFWGKIVFEEVLMLYFFEVLAKTRQTFTRKIPAGLSKLHSQVWINFLRKNFFWFNPFCQPTGFKAKSIGLLVKIDCRVVQTIFHGTKWSFSDYKFSIFLYLLHCFRFSPKIFRLPLEFVQQGCQNRLLESRGRTCEKKCFFKETFGFQGMESPVTKFDVSVEVFDWVVKSALYESGRHFCGKIIFGLKIIFFFWIVFGFQAKYWLDCDGKSLAASWKLHFMSPEMIFTFFGKSLIVSLFLDLQRKVYFFFWILG